jgi:hypothetical protein
MAGLLKKSPSQLLPREANQKPPGEVKRKPILPDSLLLQPTTCWAIVQLRNKSNPVGNQLAMPWLQRRRLSLLLFPLRSVVLLILNLLANFRIHTIELDADLTVFFLTLLVLWRGGRRTARWGVRSV